MQRKCIGLAVGVGCGVLSSLLLYRLFCYYRSKAIYPQDQSAEQDHVLEDRLIYEQPLLNLDEYRFHSVPPTLNNNISQIRYKLILSLNKGNSYKGVIVLYFQVKSNQKLEIDCNIQQLQLLQINCKAISRENVVFKNQKIHIEGSCLKQGQNQIEIVFQSKYSFLNEGISCYFLLDTQGKYSLRQQVIFTNNGPSQISKMFPCFNCTNQVEIELSVIHPDGFEAFSNMPRLSQSICSIQDYPQYPYLFSEPHHKSVNRGLQIAGTLLASSIESSSMTSSVAEFRHQTKFYSFSAPSIHQFFMLCSSMMELRQASSMESEEFLLVRYFCKESKHSCLSKQIKTLHSHLMNVYRRLEQMGSRKHIVKVDVFFLCDPEIEGYAAPGVIILCDEAFEEKMKMRTFYLLARAMVQIIQIEKKQPILLKSEILTLNSKTVQLFPEFLNFLYLKQFEYQKPRQYFLNAQMDHYQFQLLKYYQKEAKFILQELPKDALFMVKELVKRLKKDDSQSYWNYFLTEYGFIADPITELLLKISIRDTKMPHSTELKEQTQKVFQNSKYWIHFLTEQEIEYRLPELLEKQQYDLEKRLPSIKIPKQLRNMITERYEKYLALKSNRNECKTLYERLKRFRQGKNFHHRSILAREVERIKLFGDEFIQPEQKQLECGLLAWKILVGLKIVPTDAQYLQFLKAIEEI